MKKQNKKKMIFGIFTIIIMVGGGVGIFANRLDTNETYSYGEYDFTRTQGQWYTEIDGQRFGFMHHPDEVEDINYTERDLSQVYLTFDINSDAEVSLKETQSYMADRLNKMGVRVAHGLLTETEHNVPVITCENATSATPVFVFEQADEPSLSTEGDCIHVKGFATSGMVRMVDRMLYGELGVI